MRLAGWEVRLAEWAERRQGAPFAWGETDCAMLALEAFDLLTGQNVTAKYRGRYDSEFGAARLAREEDIDLARGLRSLGCREARAGFQQRGDIIVVPSGPHLAGHVCLGAKSLSAAPETGVAWFDSLALARANGAVILRVP